MLERDLQMGPDLFRAQNVLAVLYDCNGQYEKSLRQRQEIVRMAGRADDAEQIAAAYERGGVREDPRFEAIFEKLHLPS